MSCLYFRETIQLDCRVRLAVPSTYRATRFPNRIKIDISDTNLQAKDSAKQIKASVSRRLATRRKRLAMSSLYRATRNSNKTKSNIFYTRFRAKQRQDRYVWGRLGIRRRRQTRKADLVQIIYMQSYFRLECVFKVRKATGDDSVQSRSAALASDTALTRG